MVHFACQDGRGGLRGKRMVGSWQEDLIYCLRMKTTDKTLNLRFSETIAMKENGTAFRGQAVQRLRRSPSTSPSLVRRKRRQRITLLKWKVMANKSSSRSKGWKQKSGWRSSSPAGDSQSSQEHWTKADKKETRLREVTKKSTEQMKDEKASWPESLKASQKREDELVT